MSGKERRVYCDGCFDLVHYGHANSLRQAKQMGDVLVVGVHNDADITKYKGPPVFYEQERYQMVRGIKWVDEVVEGSTYWPNTETLSENRCEFVAHGDDLSITKDGKDPYNVLRDAGKLRLFKRTEGVSTTDIVGRMLLLTCTHHNRTNEKENYIPKSLNAKGSSPWTNVGGNFLQTSNKIAQFTEGKEPKPGDKVVYVCGDWDLLHPGHLDFLETAKREGDFLIVGIHSDTVMNEKKGGNYPIMNLHERTLSLLACRHVDEVVIGAPYNVSGSLMDQLKVDTVIHGWTPLHLGPEGVDPFQEPKRRNQFKILDTGNRLSTSGIVRRIIDHRLDFEARNSKKETREVEAVEKSVGS